MHPKNTKNAKKNAHRNCKNYTKNAKNNIYMGSFKILGISDNQLSSYWFSPKLSRYFGTDSTPYV